MSHRTANPTAHRNALRAMELLTTASLVLLAANTGQNTRATAGFTGFMPSYNLNFVAGAAARGIADFLFELLFTKNHRSAMGRS